MKYFDILYCLVPYFKHLLTICISYITTAREKKESSQDLPVIIGSVAGSALAFIVIGVVSIYIWRGQLA